MRKCTIPFICLLAVAILYGCPPNEDIDTTPDFTGVSIENIVYGHAYIDGGNNTTTLSADVYTAGFMPSSLVVAVHGGGFSDGARDDPEMQWMCCELARAGYTVASIDYRLGGNIIEAMHAATVDVVTALCWASSEGYGSVYLVGESAGAVACIQAAADPGAYLNDDLDLPDLNDGLPATIAAVVSLWGGKGLAEITETMPPTMMIHGTNDDTTGASWLDSVLLDADLANHDVEHNLILLPGYGHGAWSATTEHGSVADAAAWWLKTATTNGDH